MIGKSFVAASFSYLFFFIFAFIDVSILQPILHPGYKPVESFLYVFVYGTLLAVPVIAVLGLVLQFMNVLIARSTRKANAGKNKIYFLYCLLFFSVPFLLFPLYDLYQYSRFGVHPGFVDTYSEFAACIPLAIIAIFVNRKIVWKNFRKEPYNGS
jgi:hypothetical protein